MECFRAVKSIICSDIPACTYFPCSEPHASCDDVIGGENGTAGRTCSCNAGWVGDGNNCTGEESSVCSEIVAMPGVVVDAGDIQLAVNGDVKQQSNVDKLIWNVREIIADLSLFYRLQPGDLIYTGTPEGVGAVLPGDRIHGHVEGVSDVALTVGPPIDSQGEKS